MTRLRSILLLVLITLQLNAQDEREMQLLRDQISRFGQAEIEFANPGRAALIQVSSRISIYNVYGDLVKATVSVYDTAYMATFPYKFEVINANGRKAVESAQSVEEAMNWNLYPTYPQYDTIMHKLADDYPSLCRVDTIGESIEGRLILSLKISDNVAIDEQEPQVFYSSTIHGDELAGYVLMLRFAEHLLINADNGGIEQQLLDSLEIFINPLANPDGTYYGGDTISTPVRYNSNGVDLNRNFPDPTAPLIVPQQENIRMIDYLENHNFVLSANFHSGAEVLNFPWDKTESWSDGKHADSTWFFQICKQYADTVHSYAPPDYLDTYYGSSPYPGVVRGDDWYDVTGSRQDYVTYERQGREVTIELTDSKQIPASFLNNYWDYNYRSLMTFLSSAFYGIHGIVVDDDTDIPLEAMIFMSGHDRDSSHVYSEPVNGSFVRLIDKGNWNLAVSADGYEPLYLNNVQVSDFQQTWLEIRMLPEGTGIDDTTMDKIKIWPIPTGDFLNIELPKGFGNEAIVSVYNINGTLLMEEQVLVTDSSYILNLSISSLPSGIYLLRIENSRNQKAISGRFIVR